MPEDHPLVAAYMRAAPRVEMSASDGERIARGQRLFELLGPEMLLVLGACALPLAYAAGNGVQVIYRSRRLKEEPFRRLCDTAQMVINVMQPGQLNEGGIGWYTARKVRLIHGLIRNYVRRDSWSMEWGQPINQEDLAGTLLTFSVVVLHGIKRMGARIDQLDADGYVAAWSAVGRLLGVDETLLARDEREARALATRIGIRQVRSTSEGRELSLHLVHALEGLFPFTGYAPSLMRFFLDDTPLGSDLSDVLGLPAANWTKWLVRVRAAQKRAVLQWLPHVPGARWRRSRIARYFVQSMLILRRPDAHGPFDIPSRFAVQWGLAAGPSRPGP